ncbi:hypothetical protein BCR44DRAFT_1447551, partial [Catenaria anguillulae PL171]
RYTPHDLNQHLQQYSDTAAKKQYYIHPRLVGWKGAQDKAVNHFRPNRKDAWDSTSTAKQAMWKSKLQRGIFYLQAPVTHALEMQVGKHDCHMTLLSVDRERHHIRYWDPARTSMRKVNYKSQLPPLVKSLLARLPRYPVYVANGQQGHRHTDCAQRCFDAIHNDTMFNDRKHWRLLK